MKGVAQIVSVVIGYAGVPGVRGPGCGITSVSLAALSSSAMAFTDVPFENHSQHCASLQNVSEQGGDAGDEVSLKLHVLLRKSRTGFLPQLWIAAFPTWPSGEDEKAADHADCKTTKVQKPINMDVMHGLGKERYAHRSLFGGQNPHQNSCP